MGALKVVAFLEDSNYRSRFFILSLKASDFFFYNMSSSLMDNIKIYFMDS